MLNLNYSVTNEIDTYLEIVKAKKELLRVALNPLEPRIRTAYSNYLKNFTGISAVLTTSFFPPDSDNLKHCYNSETIPLAKLKSSIISSQSLEFQALCAYCLIHNHTTFDHYVGISEFLEFGVLAKNLVPCCYTCNKHKYDYWRVGNTRKIIHFYNDVIPNLQFLFVRIRMHGNLPEVTFELRNAASIPLSTYELIGSHFERLQLISRYNELAGLKIADLKDDIEAQKANLHSSSYQSLIRNTIIHKANNYKTRYGVNYWLAVLWEELANTPAFISTL